MIEAEDPVTMHVEPFLVLGIEARTSNAREMGGHGAIGALWGRLMNDNFLAHIPHRVDNHVIAVYTNYESDKDGEYSYLLGAQVNSIEKVPEEMASCQIVAGEYGMFTATGGPPAEMIVGIWKQIWSLEAGRKLERAYRTDFEIYSSGTTPSDTLVDVYIGLLPRD